MKQKARQEPSIKLAYEQYHTIANLLIKHLKHLEQAGEVGTSAITALLSYLYSFIEHVCVRARICIGKHGLRCWDLVNWYLQEIEEDIHSEQELLENKLRAKIVIDRLIKHVSLPTHFV